MKTGTITKEDRKTIISFFSTERELLHSFPSANYPFNENDFDEQVAKRYNLTKLVNDEEIIGFACLYDIEREVSCYIGNVIVNSKSRNAGVGTILIKRMIDIAVESYNVKNVLINCWCENTSALLFYSKMGFKPVSLFEVTIGERRIPVLGMMKTI